MLKQETVSGSGISWAMCKSAPRSRQITMPAPQPLSFLQAGCPSCHPTNSVKALKAFTLRLHIFNNYLISLQMSVMNIPDDSLIVHGYLGSLASVDITVSISFFTADHFITVIVRPAKVTTLPPWNETVIPDYSDRCPKHRLLIQDSNRVYIKILELLEDFCLQCFDAVGWASGTASSQ